MKLAEALSLRADYQKRLAQLRERLVRNAKVQEGDAPAEDPVVLLEELNSSSAMYGNLIARINLSNSKILLKGQTLTELIAKRDTLGVKVSILRDFLTAASEKLDRYSNKEIKVLSTVDVAILQKEVDQLCRELRELDVALQGANWTNDLV